MILLDSIVQLPGEIIRVLTYLKCTSKRSEKNGIEEQNFSRVETGCIRGKVIEYTSQDQGDKEVTEKSRVGQGHVSLKTLEATAQVKIDLLENRERVGRFGTSKR